MIFNISFNKQILVCVNIHRPPYSKQHRCTLKMFLEELEIFICNILSQYDNIRICGDFNIPCNNVMDTQVSEFLQLLQTKNLHQLTKTSTDVQENILDLIVTNNDSCFIGTSVKIDYDFSSQITIQFIINFI